ncbi:hypothetical protein AB6E26_22790 [Vibrio splendidus]
MESQKTRDGGQRKVILIIYFFCLVKEAGLEVRREIGLLLTLFLSWREKFVASLSPLVILFCGKCLF